MLGAMRSDGVAEKGVGCGVVRGSPPIGEIMMTGSEAVSYYDSGKWNDLSDVERAHVQIHEDRLCMPFGVFLASVSAALGREIMDVELAMDRERIAKEIDSRERVRRARELDDLKDEGLPG